VDELHRIIWGKSPIDRIVSIEVEDDTAYLFRELEDGSVDVQEVPNRYWMVCSKNPNDWHRLKGDQTYRYGRQYTNRREFLDDRKALKQYGYDVFSVYDPREALCIKDGYTFYKNMRISDVSILSFDIESTSLNVDDTAKVLIIANTFRHQGTITRKMFCFDDYESEAALIDAWCSWVRDMDPSIICGHNIVSYDLLYLHKLAQRAGTQLKLGRDGSKIVFETWDSKFRKDQTQSLHYRKCRIFGREVIDTMFLAIKYDIVEKKYESYALKKIIAQEGWEVEGRQHYEADQIRHRYTDPVEWAKIKEYAKFDADDALMLFDQMAPAQFYMAQSVPKNFQLITESATGAQINAILLRAYIQDGHTIPKTTEVESFKGAFSLGVPGSYKNCLSFDVQSLYPSIMLEYQVYEPKKDPAGYFLKTLEYFTQKRLDYKQKMKDTGDRYYDDRQNSLKILVNSYYGVFGAPGLNFNSIDQAAFITTKGREILNKAVEWATNKSIETFLKDNIDTEDEQLEAV